MGFFAGVVHNRAACVQRAFLHACVNITAIFNITVIMSPHTSSLLFVISVYVPRTHNFPWDVMLQHTL